MRPELERIIAELLATSTHEVSLDEIGERIGTLFVTQSEIDEVLTRLESSGRQVGSVTPAIREHLQGVLAAARALRQMNNVTPSVDDIAMRTGFSVGEVRAALLYASVLSR
jgi:hypothetical protein